MPGCKHWTLRCVLRMLVGRWGCHWSGLFTAAHKCMIKLGSGKFHSASWVLWHIPSPIHAQFFTTAAFNVPAEEGSDWLGVLIGCACSASVFVCTVCDKDMIQSFPAEHFDVMRSWTLFPSLVNGLNVAADRCMFQSIILIPCKWKKNSNLQLVQDSWRCRRLGEILAFTLYTEKQTNMNLPVTHV